MPSTQLAFTFPPAEMPPPITAVHTPANKPLSKPISSGEKGKARDIIAAIKTLHLIEREKRPATPEEKQVLARFAGFGPVALSIFPNPVTGLYKDGWKDLGQELEWLLQPDEYDSAKRTTFNAFYTSPTVIASIHEAISRLGVPRGATILEPLCDRAHNGSCVAQVVMWRPGDGVRYFRGKPSLDAT